MKQPSNRLPNTYFDTHVNIFIIIIHIYFAKCHPLFSPYKTLFVSFLSLFHFSTEISQTFSTLTLPSEDDFNGASAALLRLQRTFALQTDDVAEGRILNEPAVKPLAEDDFVHIGNIALQVFINGSYVLIIT